MESLCGVSGGDADGHNDNEDDEDDEDDDDDGDDGDDDDDDEDGDDEDDDHDVDDSVAAPQMSSWTCGCTSSSRPRSQASPR